MNDTPTPRTDEAAYSMGRSGEHRDIERWCDLLNESRKLEKELTAARKELADWRILNGWGGTPEIINDFIKGQQTRIYYERNLEEELTAITEQRDRLVEDLNEMISICSCKTEDIDTVNEIRYFVDTITKHSNP